MMIFPSGSHTPNLALRTALLPGLLATALALAGCAQTSGNPGGATATSRAQATAPAADLTSAARAEQSPTTLTMGALQAGTAYETPVYTYESPHPGPTLVFIGGIHGNEKSGHLAMLDAIERGISLSRGRLVMIPSFNRMAVEQNRRTLSRSGSELNGQDFNRMFPVGEPPISAIGRELWELLKAQPDLAFVVDFHDGFVTRSSGERGLGNTLLRTAQPQAMAIGQKLRDTLEAMRPANSVGLEWDARGWPIADSLIRKVGRDLGVPGILIELSGRTVQDPLPLRKLYVFTMIRLIGEENGIEIVF